MDILKKQGRATQVIAVVSKDNNIDSNIFSNVVHLKNDDDVLSYPTEEVKLVNAIGFLPGNNIRKKISDFYHEKGYLFETIISIDSIVSEYSKINQGVQIFPGAIVQANVVIGNNTIVNTGSIIEHDSVIGADTHIAPRATICGGVYVSCNTFIGANTTIIQNKKVGKNVIVGAGVTVKHDLEDHEFIKGS